MSIKTDIALAVGVGSALLVVLWYSKKKVGAAVDAVVPLVNPADSRNVVNQTVESIGSAVTGDPNFTVGGAIYDGYHDQSGNGGLWTGKPVTPDQQAQIGCVCPTPKNVKLA